MAQPVSSYTKLIRFAKSYAVEKDEDYKAAAKTYAEEVQLIGQMREQLAADGITIEKTYVKGRENVCIHPIIQELPKHIDCANRTLAVLIDIIAKRGKQPMEADGLDEFRI